MAYYFDEDYYLASKTAQLKAAKIKDDDGKDFTAETLKAGLASLGLTPQQHYEQHGRDEGLNPNPYFNEYEYLQAKTKQLNSIKFGGRSDWTSAEVLKGMLDSGMLPVEHYEWYGCYETDANGNFINPSNAFDANAYWSAKLLLLQKTDPSMTLDTMVKGFQAAGLSPVTHYVNHGADEADASGTALAQTVPMDGRVANDPMRETVGRTVPANYNPATDPPGNKGAAVTKPADVGGLADTSVSPTVTLPDKNLPVPGDAGFVSAPDNVIDYNKHPVIAPTTSNTGNVSDYFIVPDTDQGFGVVVGHDGAILGQVPITVGRDENGNVTAALPDSANGPAGSLSPADKDNLPPGVIVDDSLPNNFGGENPGPGPDPDTSGITIAQADGGNGLDVGNSIKKGTQKSGFAVDADGKVVNAYGMKDGEAAPTAVLADMGTVDATAVTGTGELAVDLSAFTRSYDIKGSGTARNTLTLGKALMGAHGGSNDDTFTLHAEHSNANAVVHLGGTGGAGDTVTVAGGGSADARLSAVNGIDGRDNVTLAGSDSARLWLNTLDLNGGADVAVIGKNANVDTLKAGAGSADVTVEAGGEVLNINAQDGNAALTAAVSGWVSTINGGSGDDTITVNAGGLVADSIRLRGGNNEVVISGTVGGALFAGSDSQNTQTVTVRQGGASSHIILAGNSNTITVDKGGTAGVVGFGIGITGTQIGGRGDLTGDVTLNGEAFAVWLGHEGGTLTMGDGAKVVERIAGGNADDTFIIHAGALVTGTNGIDGGGGDDTLKVTGNGSLVLEKLSRVRTIDLKTASGTTEIQRLTFDALNAATDMTVTADEGDSIVFRGLTNKIPDNTEPGSSGQWSAQADGTLRYRDGHEVITVSFSYGAGAGTGTLYQDAGGRAAWYAGTTPTGITGSITGTTFLVEGSALTSGVVVGVEANGDLSWTGAGGVPPSSIASATAIDASQVRGPGELAIHSAFWATRHTVTGSRYTNNNAALGAGTELYTGGALDDVVSYTLSDPFQALTINDTAGRNTLNLNGSINTTLELDGAFTGSVTGVLASELTLGIAANAAFGDLSLTGSGIMNVTVNAGATAGNITTGMGSDDITVLGTVGNINTGNGSGEKVTIGSSGTAGDITLPGANSVVSVAGTAGNILTGGGTNNVTVTGRAGDITTGAGGDTVSLEGTASAGNVNLGNGNDLLHLSPRAQYAAINGGDGRDRLVLDGAGTWNLMNVTNMEVLDMTYRPSGALTAQAVTLGSGVSGFDTIIVDHAGDTVRLGSAQLAELRGVDNNGNSQGVIELTDGNDAAFDAAFVISGTLVELRLGAGQTMSMAEVQQMRIKTITGGADTAETLNVTSGITMTFGADNCLRGMDTVSFASAMETVTIDQGGLDGAVAFTGLGIGDKIVLNAQSGNWIAVSSSEAVDEAGELWFGVLDNETAFTYWDSGVNAAVTVIILGVESVNQTSGAGGSAEFEIIPNIPGP